MDDGEERPRFSLVIFCFILVVFISGCEGFETSVSKAANQAISSNDPTKCNSLKDFNDRDSCFEKVGLGLNSSKSCSYIRNESREVTCYGTVAIEARSYEPCEKIDSMLSKLKCYSMVTGVKGMDLVDDMRGDDDSEQKPIYPSEIIIKSVEGDVRIVNEDGSSIPAKAGMRLGNKQALVAMDDSVADVEIITTSEGGDKKHRNHKILDNAALYGQEWPNDKSGEYTAVAGGVR